jgi:hypothetical protein
MTNSELTQVLLLLLLLVGLAQLLGWLFVKMRQPKVVGEYSPASFSAMPSSAASVGGRTPRRVIYLRLGDKPSGTPDRTPPLAFSPSLFPPVD